MGKEATKPAELSELELAKKAIAKDRGRYEAAKDSFDSMKEKLDGDFKSQLSASLSEEEQEIFELGDPLAIDEILQSKRESFIDEKIEEERLALEEFEKQISENEAHVAELEVSSAFAADNPDMDMEGFSDWVQKGISPNAMDEYLKKSDGDKAALYALLAKGYAAETGQKKEESPDLTTDLSNVPGEKGDIDNGDDVDEDADDAYLRSVGLS